MAAFKTWLHLAVLVVAQQDAFHDEERDGKLQMTSQVPACRAKNDVDIDKAVGVHRNGWLAQKSIFLQVRTRWGMLGTIDKWLHDFVLHQKGSSGE